MGNLVCLQMTDKKTEAIGVVTSHGYTRETERRRDRETGSNSFKFSCRGKPRNEGVARRESRDSCFPNTILAHLPGSE